MFHSTLAAQFIKVRLLHILASVFFDNTVRKHLTLIRINSGREQANSPHWQACRRGNAAIRNVGSDFTGRIIIFVCNPSRIQDAQQAHLL